MSELRRTRQEARNRGIVVELSDTRFIDPMGEPALAEMITEGAWLTATGVYGEYVIDRLMKQTQSALARWRRKGASAGNSASAGLETGASTFIHEGDTLK